MLNFEKLSVTLVAPSGAMIACMFSLLPYERRLMVPEEHEYWMMGLAELTDDELQPDESANA